MNHAPPAPSLEAQAVYEDATSRGVAITVTPSGNLQCKPKRLLTEDLLGRIRGHKAGIVQLLSDPVQDHAVKTVKGVKGAHDPDTYAESGLDTFVDTFTGEGVNAVKDPPAKLPPRARRSLEAASSLGLVATWSREFGFVSIHDPLEGEWHDIATKEAPDWAVREARKRRELYKAGNRGAYRLTARELEEVWESERVPEPEGTVEDDPAVTERGILYEDYLEED